jgi:hypothetical protein
MKRRAIGTDIEFVNSTVAGAKTNVASGDAVPLGAEKVDAPVLFTGGARRDDDPPPQFNGNPNPSPSR